MPPRLQLCKQNTNHITAVIGIVSSGASDIISQTQMVKKKYEKKTKQEQEPTLRWNRRHADD